MKKGVIKPTPKQATTKLKTIKDFFRAAPFLKSISNDWNNHIFNLTDSFKANLDNPQNRQVGKYGGGVSGNSPSASAYVELPNDGRNYYLSGLTDIFKIKRVLGYSNRSPFWSIPNQSVQADLGLRGLALCQSPYYFRTANDNFSGYPIGRCRGKSAVGGSPSAAFCSLYEENACTARPIISLKKEVLVRWVNRSPVVRQPGFPFFSTYPAATFGVVWSSLFMILISLVIKHPE